MAQLTTSYQKIGTGSVKTFDATKARIDLYAKYNSQSIPNNNTEWQIEARLVKVSGGYIGEYTGTELKLSGDNISKTESLGTGNFDSRTLGNAIGTTGHNADGTKSVSASASMKFKAWGITLTVSGSATLPTIPRYAAITSFSVSKRDETSVLFNWTADATCDYARYSKDNGSTWYDLPANNIVTGLSAGTSYNFKLQVRRQDSQLWTESGTVPQSTYPYPSCLSATNFIIGNGTTLTFNNPRNRSFQIQMWSYKNSQFVTDLITINPATNVPYTLTPQASRLYQSIPNDTSSQFTIDVWADGNKSTKTYAGTYTINESQCKPIFANTNYTYEDTNSNTTAMTGNNQILVDGYSIPKFNITTRATPVNYAGSITGYTCYWGNKFESYLEQDIGTYWSKQIPNTFTLSYDSNTKMNAVSCTGISGWECLYFPVKTVSGQKYRLTFDYVNTNGYTPLSGYNGIPCQIITKVDDSDNVSNQIASVLLDPTASASTRNLTVNFTAVGATTYICFNFGCAADGTTTNISLGNFELDMVGGSGNYISIQATDSRQQSTYADKTITNIPYINATVNSLGTQREDGVDTKTYLAGKFNIYNGSWDGTNNANSQNRLKYVGYSVYKNNTWSTYYDITTAVLNNATVTTDGNTKTYEIDFDDEIQIHENGSSGGFTAGTEFPIRVLIKDGNSSTIFVTDYQAVTQAEVSDGTVATCLHKDSNGKYHLGINEMSNDTDAVAITGSVSINGSQIIMYDVVDTW